MPKAADSRRFGVAHGDHEALRLWWETAPGELRGNVLAAGAKDAADLRHRQLLALPQVVAGQREGGRWGKVLVGVIAHLTSPVLKRRALIGSFTFSQHAGGPVIRN